MEYLWIWCKNPWKTDRLKKSHYVLDDGVSFQIQNFIYDDMLWLMNVVNVDE